MKNDSVSKSAVVEAICEEFSEVYCYNCEHQNDGMDYCDDCYRKYMKWSASKKTVKRVVKKLPSAQQWIMCSPDTMPKMTDIYLVKVRINQYGEGMYPTFRTALWHTASKKWFVHESENSIIGDITAWMPIPWEGKQA